MVVRIAPPDLQLTPARKNELVRTLDNFFLHRLQDLLHLFFDEAEFRLFSNAQRADSNQQQTQLLETLTQLKRNRQQLEATALGNLQNGINSEIGPPQKPISAAQLSLIEHDVLEAQLILESIIRKADQRWFEPLYCLAKRYSLLRDAEIDTHDLPCGIVAVSKSVHAALQTQVPLTLLPTVLRSFDQTVLQHLGEIYDALNERLKQAGILPNLEIDLWRELHQRKIGTVANALKEAATSSIMTDSGTISDEQHDDIGPAQNVASAELFSAASEILKLLHNPTATSETGVEGDRTTVLSILEALQNEGGETSTSLLQRLHDHITKNNVAVIDDSSADTLRFVDNLFSELDIALRNTPALAETLRQLQIPLAQTTVNSPELLGDANHPAHQFINLLMALANRAELPNAPLEQKLSNVVTPLTEPTADRDDLFRQANSELAPVIAQQNKARERNIRRIVDIYEGQQQLAQAHAAVDRELLRRCTNGVMPAPAVQLLEQGWRHLLTLTFTRNGGDSHEWSEALALLDELLWHLNLIQTQSIDSQSTPHLAAVAKLIQRISEQLNQFFPGEYRITAVLQDVLKALLGEQPFENIATPWQQTAPRNPRELQLELDQAYPHLVRWFRRAREFNINDEFVHFRDPSLRERYTLVWIGDNHQHFVFVNVRGLKAFDFDLVDLANEMAKGLYPVGQQAQWPAIEQAILDTANEAYQQLAFNSTHDALTGLLNRKEFEHRLGDALLAAKNEQLQHALLFIDIDQFSLINNLIGHVAGDAVLAHVGQLIADHSPSMALLARAGSNEFAVLIEDCNLVQAQTFAEDICRSISHEPYLIDEHRLNISVSIGVIAINKYADGTVTLLRDAVAAANTAKELGRNRVYVLESDSELHTRREKLLQWIDKMNDLLDNDYLVLRAQPIVPTTDNAAAEHYEILLGLRDKEGGVMPPGEFIEAAECYNRMQRVDRWVIERAFAWMAERSEKQLPLPQLSINLSGNSLNDASLLDFLVDQFGNHGVTPGSICFEITETATIKNLTNAADFIQQVKKIGCSFALDDFGTGLSSYEYLKHLPVDYLKIDGMFIVDIDKNASDYAMVKSINEIAHFMGKKTIAEFVESEAALSALREIGIDFVQGYCVGEPKLLADIQPH